MRFCYRFACGHRKRRCVTLASLSPLVLEMYLAFPLRRSPFCQRHISTRWTGSHWPSRLCVPFARAARLSRRSICIFRRRVLVVYDSGFVTHNLFSTGQGSRSRAVFAELTWAVSCPPAADRGAWAVERTSLLSRTGAGQPSRRSPPVAFLRCIVPWRCRLLILYAVPASIATVIRVCIVGERELVIPLSRKNISLPRPRYSFLPPGARLVETDAEKHYLSRSWLQSPFPVVVRVCAVTVGCGSAF